MKILVVARHGNTFEEGETPRRIGARTDLPLTQKGRLQAQALGLYLKSASLIPDLIYAGPLRRTQETALIVQQILDLRIDAQSLDFLKELDYGPDENRPEDQVLARLGAPALEAWDRQALPPPGWVIDAEDLAGRWIDLARTLARTPEPSTTLLTVTSNGVARFAGHITGDFTDFRDRWGLKLAPGALGVFCNEKGQWRVQGWNIRPSLPAV